MCSAANSAVAQAKRRLSTNDVMGCTLILAAISSDRICWVSVGDSVIFHVASNRVRRLNRDHSMAPVLDQMADRGEITRDDALKDSRRGVLRSALTGNPPSLVDLNAAGMPLAQGDRVFFATDGILRIEEPRLLRLLARDSHPDLAVKDLIATLKESGQRPLDNTTLVACRYPKRKRGLTRWLKRN